MAQPSYWVIVGGPKKVDIVYGTKSELINELTRLDRARYNVGHKGPFKTAESAKASIKADLGL